MQNQPFNQVVKKVIVAVHGIGDQTEFATIKQVVTQFCRYHGAQAAVPLGNFHNADRILELRVGYPPELAEFAFTEVYWAPVPRKVAKEGFQLEEVKSWAKTIVGRVKQRMERLSKQTGKQQLKERDYPMLEEVLQEALQTLGVLEQVVFLAEKLGIFKFDLNQVMVDYLDDVQLVAEFKNQNLEIIEIFNDCLKKISELYPGAEIYLITHSEGTVVSLLGLLAALCGETKPAWLDQVRGWMTIGSPIDKHITLWPELFDQLQKPARQPAQKIEWRNYYDYGDPVGFELDEARQWLTRAPWQAFNFSQADDFGFARYPFPGKAHNDYWTDDAVFGHFIETVVYQGGPPLPKQLPDRRKVDYTKPPANRNFYRFTSWVLPYIGAFALLFGAVFVLFKALKGFLPPDYLPADVQAEKILGLFRYLSGVTFLLAGLTVVARLIRLTTSWFWRIVGALFFVFSVVMYKLLTCKQLLPCWRQWECWQTWFSSCVKLDVQPDFFNRGLVWIAVAALVLSIFAGLFRPKWGMRTLLIPGALGLVWVVVRHLSLNDNGARLWPLFLATAFFLYLWWLVALLFDLVFVWHRYIRYSVANEELRTVDGERRQAYSK
jgi:hypothetical protein